MPRTRSLHIPQVELFHAPNVSDGIAKIFNHYADHSAKNNFSSNKWNVGNFLKFCSDFEITEELSHLPLQRIFQDCAQVEYSEGRGNMSRVFAAAANFPGLCPSGVLGGAGEHE